MHIHLHMQMNMSTGYKPEFKELGLSPKLQYHQKSIRKEEGKTKSTYRYSYLSVNLCTVHSLSRQLF